METMSTDTPETDAVNTQGVGYALRFYAMKTHARKLERERDEARVLADRLAALLQRERDGYGGQMVDPECDCCDCKRLKPIDEALATWKEVRCES